MANKYCDITESDAKTPVKKFNTHLQVLVENKVALSVFIIIIIYILHSTGPI